MSNIKFETILGIHTANEGRAIINRNFELLENSLDPNRIDQNLYERALHCSVPKFISFPTSYESEARFKIESIIKYYPSETDRKGWYLRIEVDTNVIYGIHIVYSQGSMSGTDTIFFNSKEDRDEALSYLDLVMQLNTK